MKYILLFFGLFLSLMGNDTYAIATRMAAPAENPKSSVSSFLDGSYSMTIIFNAIFYIVLIRLIVYIIQVLYRTIKKK